MSKDYIPTNNSDFNNFQLFLNVQVNTNATTWNIPATEVTALETWSMGYANVYKDITNVETRTRQQVLAHDAYRTDFVAFLRPFVQGYLVNNPLIPISERVAMGLNPRGLNPRSERPAITTTPILALKPLGGGLVQFAFRVDASSKRSARQPDSNGVEVFFKVVSQVSKTEPVPVLAEGVEPDPNNPAETGFPTAGYEKFFSTRARFNRQMPLTDIGKTLHVYARWVNTSQPSKNGNYSMVSTTVIS